MYKVRWSMRDLTYNAVSTEFGKLPNRSGNVRDHCENTVLEALVGDWGTPFLPPGLLLESKGVVRIAPRKVVSITTGLTFG